MSCRLSVLRCSNLGRNSLSGDIPPFLWSMPSIAELYVARPVLVSPLCFRLGACGRSLPENRFGGTLPTNITQMPSLRKLCAACRESRQLPTDSLRSLPARLQERVEQPPRGRRRRDRARVAVERRQVHLPTAVVPPAPLHCVTCFPPATTRACKRGRARATAHAQSKAPRTETRPDPHIHKLPTFPQPVFTCLFRHCYGGLQPRTLPAARQMR
jgi:hypothetical protein